MDLFYQHFLFLGLVQLVRSGGSNYDPHRWIISYKKPTKISTTEAGFDASFSTDGDYDNVYNSADGPGSNYTESKTENTPAYWVDLGKSVPVTSVQINPTGNHLYLTVRIGDDDTLRSTANVKCFSGDIILYNRIFCRRKKGRYVHLIRKHPSSTSKLKLVEVAVLKKPIENLAYMKNAASTEAFGNHVKERAVDMRDATIFASAGNPGVNWIRIDLADSYLVHEVLISARICCSSGGLKDFNLRIGESLTENGNKNPLCVKSSLFTGEVKSFYCDMFGRYVNIDRNDPHLEVAEIVVNPETTENVAVLAEVNANVDASGHPFSSVVDTFTIECYISQIIESSKQIWINLGADYNVAMIFIVNNIDLLNELVDFQISVGMSDQFSESTLCVPGLQSLEEQISGAFHCEPDRILGNHVFIHQERTDKQLSVCEVGVFEETKPKIQDHRTNRYVWLKEGSDITLDCDAKGYPTPVTSWVKNKVVIESGSSSLQVLNVKSREVYECWANNTNGFDARLYELKATSELRTCVGYRELNIKTDKPVIDEELEGHKWYKFYDTYQHKELQFRKNHVPSCTVWMQGSHPSLEDGVVSRTLCVKNDTHDCSKKLDIHVRRCAHYYVYNSKDFRDVAHLTFCMKNAGRLHSGFQPVMISPTPHHALSGKTFLTEEGLQELDECLMLCQLEKKCKSFNFSQKLQICELNSGKKKEFPGNFAANNDYDYYQLGQGSLKVSRQDL